MNLVVCFLVGDMLITLLWCGNANSYLMDWLIFSVVVEKIYLTECKYGYECNYGFSSNYIIDVIGKLLAHDSVPLHLMDYGNHISTCVSWRLRYEVRKSSIFNLYLNISRKCVLVMFKLSAWHVDIIQNIHDLSWMSHPGINIIWQLLGC